MSRAARRGALVWFVVLLAFAVVVATGAAQRVPLATAADRALAPLAISLDGKTYTFRAVTTDDTQICVEPAAFGRRRCYAVRELRAGLERAR